MKKILRKGIAFVLILALTTALISGCSKKEESEVTDTNSEKSTTIKIMFPGEEPPAQKAVTEAIEKKLKEDGLNYKLEFTFVPWDNYWSKLYLVGASGEEYDIAWTHITTVSEMVAKKLLTPLDDPLENYGQDLIANTPEYSFKETTFNGKIYGIPRVMPMSEFWTYFQVRGDLRKKYDLPPITTLDGLEEFYETIKQNEPDIYPAFELGGGFFLNREYGNIFGPLTSCWVYPLYVDPTDPNLEVKEFITSDIHKNTIMKMREWTEKGYIPADPTLFPDGDTAMNSGLVATNKSNGLRLTEMIDQFKIQMPDAELEHALLNPEEPQYIFNSTDNLLSVLSTSQHVNESVTFINWIRQSQENYDLMTYGIEGVNYNIVDGFLSYEGIAPENSYFPISWAWNDIKYARFSKNLSKEYVEELAHLDERATPNPLQGFIFDAEPVKNEVAQIQAITTEYYYTIYNLEVDFDEAVKDVVEKMEKAGLEKIKVEAQKQIDAYVNK